MVINRRKSKKIDGEPSKLRYIKIMQPLKKNPTQPMLWKNTRMTQEGRHDRTFSEVSTLYNYMDCGLNLVFQNGNSIHFKIYFCT